MNDVNTERSAVEVLALVLHNFDCDDKDLRGEIQSLDELEMAERDLGRIATVGMDRSIHLSQAEHILAALPNRQAVEAALTQAPSQPVAERLAEIEARLAAATPGPWNKGGVEDGRGWHPAIWPEWGAPIALIEPREGIKGRGVADADLIANAPADLRYLLNVARAAEACITAENEAALHPVHANIVKMHERMVALRAALRGEQ